MIYTHNNQWRSTILIDGTAEAKLADVLFIMEMKLSVKRKSASLVGGLGRLIKLIEEGKIRSDKPTNKQNGKWFCNAADVLKFAISNVENREKTRNMKKNDSQRAIA